MITLDKIEKMEEIVDWSERAKHQFGTTKNPIKAGWVIHDGSMLDFSAGHDKKYLEHAEVGRNINPGNFSDGMNTFRTVTGAIRMHASPKGGISLMFGRKPPTEHQWRVLSEIHGEIGGSLEYDDDRTSTSGIVPSINHLRAKLGLGVQNG